MAPADMRAGAGTARHAADTGVNRVRPLGLRGHPADGALGRDRRA